MKRSRLLIMEARIQKWGNSVGIRIPGCILKSLNLKPNDLLDIAQDGDRIIITVFPKKKISLAERFENYNGKNLSKDFSWDESIEREIC